MPHTYATPKLRKHFTDPSGLPVPDRRSLFYLVTCPLSNEPCHLQECEYHTCHSLPDPDDLQPHIHIAAVPGPDEPHHPMPVDDQDRWMQAINEAALLIDPDRLEELDTLQSEWNQPQDRIEARSQLIQTLSALVEQVNPRYLPRCQTCRKPHLLPDSDDCPGCTRLQDHDAPRFEH